MATTRQAPIRLTNKGFAEWQVDQALAFAKESIDSRFCPGYAMKNPTLVGILMQMQMNLENKLDAQDLQNEVEQPVTEEEEVKVPTKMNRLEMTHFILESRFSKRRFTASQAYETVRPIRTTVSRFKSEESFRGTILRELQVLEQRGILEFGEDFGEKRGTYRFL
jgi:hypothetical protein